MKHCPATGDNQWHIERKIDSLDSRMKSIQEALGYILASLTEMSEVGGPNLGDDDWLPEKTIYDNERGLIP